VPGVFVIRLKTKQNEYGVGGIYWAARIKYCGRAHIMKEAERGIEFKSNLFIRREGVEGDIRFYEKRIKRIGGWVEVFAWDKILLMI
jgi:hypothetical protein